MSDAPPDVVERDPADTSRPGEPPSSDDRSDEDLIAGDHAGEPDPAADRDDDPPPVLDGDPAASSISHAVAEPEASGGDDLDDADSAGAGPGPNQADDDGDQATDENIPGALPSTVSDDGAEPDLDPDEPEHPPARPLPRVLAIANQKGGVGKTTTAVNLGASLADLGHRVLVVDLDPQGNASTGLGINVRDLQSSMYDVILHDTPLDDCIEATSVRNLFVAPASLDLAGAEIELVPAFSRELRLKRALAEVIDDFDFVLIDCPPSLGLLTVNGLAAAGEVLVPIQCEYYALEGLGQLMRNIDLVQKNLNPTLELSTIVMVMFDARTKLADQVVREVREFFGVRVCRTVVPRTVRLSEAPSFGQPIIAFDPRSRGAIAYRELAREVTSGTAQRAG